MYAITAPRNVRALYYAAEYGVRGANKLLAVEPAGDCVVRTAGGTAARQCGLYRTQAQARKELSRLLVMASCAAGKTGRDLANYTLAEIVPARKQDFAAVSNVRPLAR